MEAADVAALWAGLTAFVWYAFGTVPLQIAVAGQLGLSDAQTAGWVFIVWFSGAALQDAMEKAFGGGMRFGALVAFIVAATPITIFGITSAFWAIVAGIAASACVERGELAAFWSSRRDGHGRTYGNPACPQRACPDVISVA